MSILALCAALGASLSWAAGALIAHTPAKRLGTFEFTRIQLISAAALLLAIVTITGGWASVSWQHWPAFATSSLVGVILGNLAVVACLRRGGPRRTQLLTTLSAPVAAVLGYVVLGELASPLKLVGGAIAIAGVSLAILFGREGEPEPIHGSLAAVIAFGCAAATCQAVALVAMKPALLAGTEPLAASALRTAGGASAMALITLWPAKAFEPTSARTVGLVLWAIFPGILGYVVAVSLLLYALSNYDTGVAAVLGSLSPVMMLPMLWLLTRRCPPVQAWAGAGLVVLGLAVILVG
jgi:drug/metabolite transporter (DMT)-like permease